MTFVSRVVLSLLAAGAAVGQAPSQEQMQAKMQARQWPEALLLVDSALAQGGDSHDWLFLRGIVLVELGRLTEATECRDRLQRLHQQRIDELSRRIAAVGAAGSAGSTPGSSGPVPSASAADGAPLAAAATRSVTDQKLAAAPPRPSVEAVKRQLEQRRAPIAEGKPKAQDQLPDALQRLAKDAVAALDGGDAETGRKLADVVLAASDEAPEASAAALVELAKTNLAEIAAAAREKFGDVLRALADAAIAAYQAGDPTTGDRYVDAMSLGVNMPSELHGRRATLEAGKRLAASGAGLRAAAALRFLAGTLNSWAAAIEQMSLEGDKRATEEADVMRSELVAMHSEPHLRDAAEHGMRQLRKSRDKGIAAAAEGLLHQWGAERRERGRQAEKADDLATAARELDAASQCDPALAQEGLDAGRYYEATNDIGNAARIYQWVAATAAGVIADQSWERYCALWRTASRDVPDIKAPRRDAPDEEWSKLLDSIRQKLPVLEGPELAALRALVAQGLRKEAGEALEAALKSLKSGAPVRPASADPESAMPRAGADFRLVGLPGSCAWVPPSGASPGFWRLESVVGQQIWFAVVRDANFPRTEREESAVWRSWNNAMRFCTDLTERERAAGRLPADHAYTLPSRAQVERMRDTAGRLSSLEGAWLWTTERCGMDQEGYLRYRAAPMDRGRDAKEWTSWQPCPGIGFTIVLTREN